MGSHIPSIEQDAPGKQPCQTMPVNFFGPSVYSKFYKALICAVVLASPMLASAQQSSINPSACVTGTVNPNTDYFPNKVQADDATYFKIEYHNSYKLLTNTMTNETFALYQCGTTAPTGLVNGTKFFSIPVNNVAVTDVSVIPYLEVSIEARNGTEDSKAIGNLFLNHDTAFFFLVDVGCGKFHHRCWF